MFYVVSHYYCYSHPRYPVAWFRDGVYVVNDPVWKSKVHFVTDRFNCHYRTSIPGFCLCICSRNRSFCVPTWFTFQIIIRKTSLYSCLILFLVRLSLQDFLVRMFYSVLSSSFVTLGWIGSLVGPLSQTPPLPPCRLPQDCSKVFPLRMVLRLSFRGWSDLLWMYLASNFCLYLSLVGGV